MKYTHRSTRLAISAAMLELASELATLTDDLQLDACGNDDSADLIEATLSALDSLKELAAKFNTRLDALNVRYLVDARICA